MKLLIAAGGQGTKLWPLSREEKPKQFQPIIGEKSLFKTNVDILLERYSPKDIFVSTKQRYVKHVVDQSPEISLENIIIEPNIAKNRGPAQGLAFLKLSMLCPEEPFFIVQSDCLRTPRNRYLDMIKEAERLVKRDKKFISGGRKALIPDMGSDYLQLGDKQSGEGSMEVYKVKKFIERLGDYKKTKELIQGFHVLTHCNHNCWYPELMLKAYADYKPRWYEALMKIKKVIGKSNEKRKIEEIYSKMDKGSTEEVTKNIFPKGYIIPVPFKWTDVGTWEAVHSCIGNGNESVSVDTKEGQDEDKMIIDSENSLIKSTTSEKVIVAIGIKDLIVVDTDDALFISKKNRSTEVKDVLDKFNLNKKRFSKYQ